MALISLAVLPPDPAHAAYVASMQGRKADALAAVQALAATAGGSGWELTPQYSALVRFGLWDELIALTPPDARAPGLTAGYLYGRGVALAARGRLAEARQALAGLERLGAQGSAAADTGTRGLSDLIAVAAPIVAARIAATELRTADAIAALGKAVAAEDRLSGEEGTAWFFPVRHLLGAQLLIAGRPAQAERVYREDLRRHPGNGWALYGLASGNSPVPGSTPTSASSHRLSGLPGPTPPAASVSVRRRTEAQPTGRRVVNFFVRNTKLVLTERTAASCSSCVDRKCS